MKKQERFWIESLKKELESAKDKLEKFCTKSNSVSIIKLWSEVINNERT